MNNSNIAVNVSNGKKILSELKRSYNMFGSKIKSEWNVVVRTLQQEWVGVDEQDYEKELAKKLGGLYADSHDMIEMAMKNIVAAVNYWLDCQSKNTISGNVSSASEAFSTRLSYDVYALPAKTTELVSYKARRFSERDNLGLANGTSSANNITTTLSQFVANIKKSINDMIESVNQNNAFYGEGTDNAIKKYITNIGNSVGIISTSIKDLGNALDVLAKQTYTKIAGNIVSEYDKEAGSVESLVSEQLAGTKWD